MEKPSAWEKGKKLVKATAMAGAMAFSPEASAQTNGNWTVVSEGEFVRNNIPEAEVQTIDLRENPEAPVDESKKGFRYIDRSGATYFWINKHPISEEEARQLYEKEVERVAEDAELKHKIEDFFSNFDVGPAWVIDPKTNKHYSPEFHYHQYINPPEELEKFDGSIVVTDKRSGKQVFMEADMDNDFFILLHRFHIWGGQIGIREYLLYSRFIRTKDTRDKKIEYIKNLLTDRLEEFVRNSPQYEPPIIAEPEIPPVGPVQNEGNKVNLEPVEEREIVIGEGDVEEAIDEVFDKDK